MDLMTSFASGSLMARQHGRAVTVTTVNLTPVNPYGPTFVQMPEITAGDSPLGTYDNPLLSAATERPKTAAELGHDLVSILATEGRARIAEASEALRGVVAQALEVTLTDEIDLATLGEMAREAGRDDLTAALDTFATRSQSFEDQVTGLLDALRPKNTLTEGEKNQLSRQAISDVAEARLIPERLRREVETQMATAILKLTGASDKDLARSLKLRRLTDHAALSAQKKDIVQDMTRAWKRGALLIGFSQTTVWAGQSLSIDTSRATGESVTYLQGYDHSASFGLSLASSTTLARV